MTARKCSHCGHNGHNARTCLNGVNKGCVKLFGVNISEPKPEQTALRKSLSLGNLESLADNGNDAVNGVAAFVDNSGYLSDGQISSKKGKAAHERKKGKPWTEEEHLTFLAGLKKLGKGDWRGISKNFVTSRTPTQVASHAQKYFLRQSPNDKRKRRASLFDIPFNDPKEKNSQPSTVESAQPKILPQASTSSSVKPLTITREPAKVNAQFEISNRFQNLQMEYRPVFQTYPSYYGAPSLIFPPMFHYPRPEPGPMVHPSGLPATRFIPIGMPPAQVIQASKSTEKDGLELQIGPPPPPPPQSPGGTDLSSQASGAIHVK